ncbi:MAG TPA: helix-turn-helix transcriptional regulator [Chitinophagaceae bacterium]|nr:helix-turn-helix transcriptional regulator [Chitinophagaceae bacterium]
MLRNIIYPRALLSPAIHHIMVSEKELPGDTITPMPFFADGYPGVIFQQSAGGLYLNDEQHRLSSFFLYGQTIKPIMLLPKGSFRIIIFFLYPCVIPAVFGLNASEIKDSCIDLDLLPSSNIQLSLHQLMEAASLQEQVHIVSDYIQTLYRANNAQQDNIIRYALEHIIHSNGQTSLRGLQKELYITERTFERRFERHVGVTPRLYSRICQFHASFRQLEQGNFTKLSDVAYENGYADQSHFTRSFKEFTGVSPLQYISQAKWQQQLMTA